MHGACDLTFSVAGCGARSVQFSLDDDEQRMCDGAWAWARRASPWRGVVSAGDATDDAWSSCARTPRCCRNRGPGFRCRLLVHTTIDRPGSLRHRYLVDGMFERRTGRNTRVRPEPDPRRWMGATGKTRRDFHTGVAGMPGNNRTRVGVQCCRTSQN